MLLTVIGEDFLGHVIGVPVVGIAAGMLLLGESVSAWQWAGVACVGAALAVVLFGNQILSKSAQ